MREEEGREARERGFVGWRARRDSVESRKSYHELLADWHDWEAVSMGDKPEVCPMAS